MIPEVSPSYVSAAFMNPEPGVDYPPLGGLGIVLVGFITEL